ncbi:MAG: hypothetical protein D6682_01455 [Zetaproteobacteria bacterium]|nr:MAG: hypothetical protein D6682_01455 [Zetaproteobacteria bacterium]
MSRMVCWLVLLASVWAVTPLLAEESLPDRVDQHSTMVRVVRDGKMRDGPSMQSAVIWWVARNDRVTLLARRGAWSKVRTKHGRIGWVGSKLLDFGVSEPAAGKVSVVRQAPIYDGYTVVARRTANMRAAPASDAPVIWWVARNDRVTLLARQGAWSRVRTKYGRVGWVGSKLLDVAASTRSAQALPAVERPTAKKPTPKSPVGAQPYTAVVRRTANMRAAPSPDAPVIWWVAVRDRVEVFRQQGGWAEVRTKSGRVGWVYLPVLQRVDHGGAEPSSAASVRQQGRVRKRGAQEDDDRKAERRKERDLPRPAATAAPPPHIAVIELGMDRTDARVLFRKDPFDESSFPARVKINHTRIAVPATVAVLGSSTRRFRKKSLLIKFSKPLPQLHNSRRLSLHAMASDGSMMREYLAWTLMRRMGMMVPQVEYVRLKINGREQGLFLAIGWIGPGMLASYHYQAQAMYHPRDEMFCGDLKAKSKKKRARCWKTIFNKQGTGITPLHRFASELAAVEPGDVASWMEAHVDVDSVIDWLAINTLLSNGDTYNKNYFLLLGADRKWHVIPWDYDLSFGRSWDPYRKYPHNIYNGNIQYFYEPDSGAPNPLKDRLLADRKLRARFIARMRVLLGEDGGDERVAADALFTPHSMARWIHTVRDTIAPVVRRDPFLTEKELREFFMQVEALQHFVEERTYYLRHLLFAGRKWKPGVSKDVVRSGTASAEGKQPNAPSSADNGGGAGVKPVARSPLPSRLRGVIDRIWPDNTVVLGDPDYRYWVAKLRPDHLRLAGNGVRAIDLHVDVAGNHPPEIVPDGRSARQCIRRTWLLYSRTPGVKDRWRLSLDYFEENARRNELGREVVESRLKLWVFDGVAWSRLPTNVNTLSNRLTVDGLSWHSGQLLHFAACSD